jgi:hypothetical protein
MKFAFISIKKSMDGIHKFEAKVFNNKTKRENTIKFGAVGHEHYTEGHLDENRRKAYEQRHTSQENWEITGANTRGWWAYNFLWKHKTYERALKDIKLQLS